MSNVSKGLRALGQVLKFYKMSTLAQIEYLRNARRAVLITQNSMSTYHIDWALSYWRMYLKSSGTKNMNKLVTDLRDRLEARDTEGALRIVSSVGTTKPKACDSTNWPHSLLNRKN